MYIHPRVDIGVYHTDIDLYSRIEIQCHADIDTVLMINNPSFPLQNSTPSFTLILILISSTKTSH